MQADVRVIPFNYFIIKYHCNKIHSFWSIRLLNHKLHVSAKGP